MSRPHTLRIHHLFTLGTPFVFKLAIQHLGTNPQAFLFEMNTRYEWFNTQSTPSADGVFLIVTSTPRRKNGQVNPAVPHIFLDGGGDGTTTFFIVNDGGADPAPFSIFTTYG